MAAKTTPTRFGKMWMIAVAVAVVAIAVIVAAFVLLTTPAQQTPKESPTEIPRVTSPTEAQQLVKPKIVTACPPMLRY